MIQGHLDEEREEEDEEEDEEKKADELSLKTRRKRRMCVREER